MRPRLTVSLRAVSVQRGGQWVLRDITWRLKPGQRWALLGDNGAGKTQLLKLLCGDIWPTPDDRASGAPGERAFRLGRQRVDLIEAKCRIAYVGGEHQDKYARYGWNLRVRDLIATGLHQTDLLLSPVTSRQAARVGAIMRACGLFALRAREFLSLSYGEKRLALLARALVRDPDWLLLDEFYNGLDAAYRGRIDAVLAQARRRGQSWVATAHRAIDVPRGTSALLELEAGCTRRIGSLRPADFAGLTRRAEEAAPRHSVAPGRTPAAVRRLHERTFVAPRTPPLMRLSDVDLYVEYRAVLKGINWQLRAGQQWSVFGANGAGKSSFLKLLYGDLAPAFGGLMIRRGLAQGAPISEWKRQVGYVSPELQSTYAVDVSIEALVASGRHSSIGLVDEPDAADRKAARHWLKFFRLTSVARRRPRELSYGQLRRALFARAMAADPRILLLDEPLTGLDPRQRALMKRLLARLMQKGITVVAAVHHSEDLPRGMTHGLRLSQRRAQPVDAYSAN